MPRNQNGVFERIPGTEAVPDTTISSAAYNETVLDFVADANAARPISAGGTGATTSAGARQNLFEQVALAQADGGTGATSLGAGTLMPTGGTTAQTLADALRLDIRGFGGVAGNGSDTALAVTTAMTELLADHPISGIDQQPNIHLIFPPGEWYFGSKVKIPSHGVQIVGEGALFVTDMDDAIFRVGDDAIFGADALSAATVYSTLFEGITFRNEALTAAASRAIEAGMMWASTIRDCRFWDFDIAIDLHGCGNCAVRDSHFYVRGRTSVDSTAFVRAQGVYSSTQGPLTGSGLRLYGNEFSGVPASRDRVLTGWLIHTIDTLYFGGNHMSFVKSHLHINPQGSANNYKNNTIIDLVSDGNNYFDDAGTGAQVLVQGNIAYDDVLGNEARSRGKLDSIRFATTDQFRGSATSPHALRVNITDTSGTAGDFLANRGLPSILIAGQIESHTTTPISVSGPASTRVPVALTIGDVTTHDGMTGGAGGNGLALIEAGMLTVANVEALPEANAPERLIGINFTGASGGGIKIAGLNARQSTYSGNLPVSVSGMTGTDNFVEISGLIERGQTGWQEDGLSAAATVVGATREIARLIDVPGTLFLAEYAFKGVLDSTDDGTGDRFASVSQSLTVRRDGAVSAVPSGGLVVEKRLLSPGWDADDLPAALCLMTGAAWASTIAYTIGTVVTSGGNAYLCVRSGTSGGAAPTGTTSALITDGTVIWAYLGATNANRLAVVFSGASGFDLRCRGRVELASGV